MYFLVLFILILVIIIESFTTYNMMKLSYYITMGLILTCFATDIIWLFNPNHKSLYLVIVNSVNLFIVLIYLALLFKKRKNILNKLNEQIHKVFSKN